jgi:uncharacterized membrane protein
MQGNGYHISSELQRKRLVSGLGWFSIGLGLAEFLFPRTLARLIGVKSHPGLFKLLGAREVANGVAILAKPGEGTPLQARVAGDAMDLALLGSAFLSSKSSPGRLTLATAAVAGITGLDILAMQEVKHAGPHIHSRPGHRWAGRVERSITVNRPAEELFQFWKNFEQLPRFMEHLISVQITGPRRSHWVAKGPGGTQVEWEAELIEEHPNELLAWRSLEGADVDHAGSVRFERAPGGRGTVVRVKMQYRPPGGIAGAKVAKLLGQSPEKQVAIDLLRFKQIIETGEIARTEGQPAGRTRSTSVKYDELVRS